jgi:DNA-binding transcriptional MocR family regulator
MAGREAGGGDMLLVTIKAGGSEPIYKQICDQIRLLIEQGIVKAGQRLPATRVLADTLGVNRSTVCRAYEDLWALGYTESRQGSYTTVRKRTAIAPAKGKPSRPIVSWAARSSVPARQMHQDYLRLRGKYAGGRGRRIEFNHLAADHELCPAREFRACAKEVLADSGKDILDYGPPEGYRPLREAIAHRMQTHGVSVSADEILITSGAQQAIDLVLRMLAGRGTAVAVEAPTYGLALPLFRFHGLDLKEIPMRDDGMDLGVLESVLKRWRPALLYTIPAFHNPTGVTTGQAHRERVLALCETHRVPLVEDGFEEEMKYFGKVVLPIKSMDRSKIVVYLGTFSKVVFPGLRIGWIAADRDCIERLVAIHRFASLSNSNLGQVAMHRFYQDGYYEKHVRRVHRVYRGRMQTMIGAIRRHFPRDGVRWTEPVGGYTLWVSCPGLNLTEDALIGDLSCRGVVVSRGSFYFPRPPKGLYFRLSCVNLTEPDIEEGVRRIGAALTDLGGK